MEIDLNTQLNIVDFIDTKENKENKNNLQIFDFIMIIDNIINKIAEPKKGEMEKTDLIQTNSSQKYMVENEIYSEFEFQSLNYVGKNYFNKDISLVSSNNENEKQENFNQTSINQQTTLLNEVLKEQETNINDRKTIGNTNNGNFSLNVEKKESKGILTVLKNEVDKKLFDNFDKTKTEHVKQEYINNTNSSKSNDFDIKSLKLDNHIQKSQQETQKDFLQIYKKEYKKEMESFDFLPTNNKQNHIKETNLEKNLNETMKVYLKDFQVKNSNKNFEFSDDKIGKIKILLNTNTKEMDIKIISQDKEIARQIDNSKNELSEEIMKNSEIQKTDIKVELDEDKNDGNRNNFEFNKKGKKKRNKNKFELLN
ncbi:MAG: hypothetical protein N2446_01885 [Elusimicrobiales bacterium]|nr:hypothetical protein [Elusimicrobiales bacterium]